MTPRAPFVAVAGNIATGKSSLVEALGETLRLDAFPERWQDNPWFGAQSNHALASQLWFLLAAGSDNARIAAGSGGIQERCIHEHALVFAPETLNDNEVRLVTDAYTLLDRLLEGPKLLVFLHASPRELERRVHARERPQEVGITRERLQDLDARYRAFVEGWTRCPVLQVDTERKDIRTPEELASVTQLIEGALS